MLYAPNYIKEKLNYTEQNIPYTFLSSDSVTIVIYRKHPT